MQEEFDLASAGGGARLQQHHPHLGTLIHNPAQHAVAVSHWGGPGGGATMHRLGEIDAAHQQGLELTTQVAEGSHIISSSLGGTGGGAERLATLPQGSVGARQLRKSPQANSTDSEHLATHKRIMDDIKVGGCWEF